MPRSFSGPNDRHAVDVRRTASDRAELFERGSIDLDAITASGGIVINRQHTRGAPITRVVPELRGDELVIDTLLPDTQAGRDAAVEIRSGLMCGLSVEFRALKQQHGVWGD